MRNKPKQNIRRGVTEVTHQNGSKHNAVYSWDITDQDASREGAAINGLSAMRPDVSKFNNVVPGDKLYVPIFKQ